MNRLYSSLGLGLLCLSVFQANTGRAQDMAIEPMDVVASNDVLSPPSAAGDVPMGQGPAGSRLSLDEQGPL